MELLQRDLKHLRIRPHASAVVIHTCDAVADADDAHGLFGRGEELAGPFGEKSQRLTGDEKQG